MAILRKPYEISLWEDILVFIYEDGNTSEEIIVDGHGPVINQYYKERKICTIGSDTMETPIRAVQGKLVSKINGENTLTFNMYSHYYDEEIEESCENPFIGLLVNERKIKLRYGALGAEDTKWYDLVIKNIQENSETKTFTYTAKDLFINELSKSGFDLQFDNELENNMGNISTLAEVVLEESDWKLKEQNDILQQKVEEPLYEIILSQAVIGKDMQSEDEIELPIGRKIYGFYSIITNKSPFFQFLYAEKYEVNDDYIITNSPNWFIENVEYDDQGKLTFAQSMEISDKYRGERIVRKQITKYDSTIDKYVSVYDNNGTQVYGYTETEFTSPATVRSYVTNPNSYESDIGWEVGASINNGSSVFPNLQIVSVPDVRDISAQDLINGTVAINSCLKLDINNPQQMLFNSGIIDQRHNINGFAQDEKYVFRIKYGEAIEFGNHGANRLVNTDTNLQFQIAKYHLENGIYNIEETYFDGIIESSYNSNEPDYKYVIVNCLKSLSYKEMIAMTKTLGLFITPITDLKTLYIQDVQFFPYISMDDTDNGEPLLPEEIKEGKVKTVYYYYVPNENYSSIDEVQYVYKDYKPANFLEVFNDNAYEKIRSITASESNRFNLLQELCEIFECWIKFEIEHNQETGEILLDENYRQLKWVSFHEYIGKENDAGFKYGINLKSIQRTIESEAIVSKMVVKNNSNEFATNGFCSIARASENPNGENFLLDFSYYIQQGMLGISEITNDLYLDINGYLGYYKKLKQINNLRDQYIEEQSGLLTDISEYQALYQTYSISVEESEKKLREKIIFVKTLTGYTYEELINDQSNNWWQSDQLIATINTIGYLRATITKQSDLLKKAEENLNNSQDRYDKLNRILTSKKESQEERRLILEKEKLNLLFYKKYSRFLQEGSWISEDYIDDNLYYLDAQSTLHTSSQPKITYNINVLELSQIEDYENYTFTLGDKTTMEDTEFFGWTFIDGVQTPYKEEIVVTELTVMLDSPEQNQIKVQNYKTQFEDLFQRITATTQSIEYSTGQYNKVSGIIQADGTINIVTLQNSIANNALTLQNSKDQSVIWDETGITTTSLNNPSEIVRIVSGGVFLSTDGGITWNTGITGSGINANYITSGQINTETINILNGAFPSFRWDGTGINAYEFTINENTGEVRNFNYGKFVRLDQYGLYGINGNSNFNPLIPDYEGGITGEEKIWEHSNFALTWKGFQIRTKKFGTEGYIRISSEEDIQLINLVEINGQKKEIDQVKIGLLDVKNGEAIYGLRLKDMEDQIVLEQSSQGKVWIRNEIKVGSSDTSTVSIGYLKDNKATIHTSNKDFLNVPKEEIHEVINANNKFLVYEDGSMKATDGEFTGVIYATGGKIGGIDIESFTGEGYEVAIESDSGVVFKNDNEVKILTAKLYKNQEEIIDGIISYQWYKNSNIIENAVTKTLEVAAAELEDQATYYCAIEYGAIN